MKTLRLLSVNLKQVFTPKMFAFAFVAAVFLLISISGMYYPEDGIWYLLERSLSGTGTAIMFFTILPTLAYATSLVDDYESGVIKYYKIRSNIYSYTISKVISSAISGFFIILFAMLIFMLILLPFNSYMYVESTYYAYEIMMFEGQVFLGSLLYLVHRALSGAIIASVAVCIATFLPDKFVAVTFPCVLYMLHGRVTSTWTLPEMFKNVYMIEGIVSGEDPYSIIFYRVLFTIITIVIACIISCIKMKGRVNNGDY